MELLLIKKPHTIAFAGNPIAFTFLVTPYRLMEQSQDIKIIFRLEVEEVMYSNNFVEVKEFFLHPQHDGTSTGTVESLLKAYLTQKIPQLNQTIMGLVEGQVTRYKISWRLLNNNTLVAGSLGTSEIFIVTKGGISYQEWHPKKYFTELLANQKPFLRYSAAKDMVMKDEFKYLTWIAGLDENYVQSLYLKIGYSDGTEGGDTLVQTIRLAPWQHCLTPAGYNQLEIDTLAEAGKTPVWYELWVAAEYDPLPVTCTPVQINAVALPDGVVGEAYTASLRLYGEAPFALASIVKPSWMSITITGSIVYFTGAPDAEDTDITVSFDVTNCSAGSSDSFNDTIDVTADPVDPGGPVTGTGLADIINDTDDGAISAVYNIDGFTPTFIEQHTSESGTHNAFTAVIEINFAAPAADPTLLRLFKNGLELQLIAIDAGDGSFKQFAVQTFLATDDLLIVWY